MFIFTIGNVYAEFMKLKTYLNIKLPIMGAQYQGKDQVQGAFYNGGVRLWLVHDNLNALKKN